MKEFCKDDHRHPYGYPNSYPYNYPYNYPATKSLTAMSL
jgi:hypothetical protein